MKEYIKPCLFSFVVVFLYMIYDKKTTNSNTYIKKEKYINYLGIFVISSIIFKLLLNNSNNSFIGGGEFNINKESTLLNNKPPF